MVRNYEVLFFVCLSVFTRSGYGGSSQGPSQGPWYARTPEGGRDDSLGWARMKGSNDSRLESRVVESRVVFGRRPNRVFEIGSVSEGFVGHVTVVGQHARDVPEVKALKVLNKVHHFRKDQRSTAIVTT